MGSRAPRPLDEGIVSQLLSMSLNSTNLRAISPCARSRIVSLRATPRRGASVAAEVEQHVCADFLVGDLFLVKLHYFVVIVDAPQAILARTRIGDVMAKSRTA